MTFETLIDYHTITAFFPAVFIYNFSFLFKCFCVISPIPFELNQLIVSKPLLYSEYAKLCRIMFTNTTKVN